MTDRPRILLIRLKSIGDILFTLPATNLVRENRPDAHLTFLTSLEHASLLRGFASVDDVLTIDRAFYKRKQPFRIVRAFCTLVRQLRQARYSLVVDFQGFGETAWLTRLTGAPQRWGNVYRSGRAWAYTQGRGRNDDLHPAEWYHSLLVQCGLRPQPIRNEFRLPTEDLESARDWLAARGFNPARPLLYLQPFTSSPHKNWPFEHYLALAEFWRQRGAQVLFSGGPDDRPALEQAQAAGFTLVAGIPRLVVAGVMKLATLIIGGDTGFLHLAVAMEKRVLMLIKLTGPGSPGPLGHLDWVVSPANSLPLASVPVAEVIRASVQALVESQPSTANP